MSGILVATFTVIMLTFGFIVFVLNSIEAGYILFEFSFLWCYFILEIAGYVGLWRNLYFSRNRKVLNSLLLLAGILGNFILLLFTKGVNRIIEWILAFEERSEIILVLWPLVVSIIIFLDNIFSKESSSKPSIIQIEN